MKTQTNQQRRALRANLHRASTVVEPLEPRRLLNAIPVGSEFQVNTTTAERQWSTAIAVGDAGDFVVAWMGQDGDAWGIFARAYDSAGVPRGAEFRVNPSPAGNQNWASAAMDADGDFVITWAGPDRGKLATFAQRYNAAGVPQGSAIRVNSISKVSNTVYGGGVAMDDSGDFIVAWAGYGVKGTGNNSDVFVRRFNADGTPLGAEIPVTNYTASGYAIDVAADADGDFVVTWAFDSNIHARRFSSAGVAQGSEFIGNTSTTLPAFYPRVAIDSDGDFVIAWYLSNPANTIADIYAQRFNAAGVPQGAEIQVNTYTAEGQLIPGVAMDAVGNFVVAWQSYGQEAPGTWGVYAQCYDSAGMPLGSEFHVNTYTTLGQVQPAVGMDSSGDFVVAWESNGQDGSEGGIFAQRFAPAAPPSASVSPFGAGPGGSLFGERLLGSEEQDDLESILAI